MRFRVMSVNDGGGDRVNIALQSIGEPGEPISSLNLVLASADASKGGYWPGKEFTVETNLAKGDD